MIIGWNKNDLLKLRDKYKALYKSEKDPNKKDRLGETVRSIEHVLDFYQNKFMKLINKKAKSKEVIEEDLMFLRDFGYYAPYIREFANHSFYVPDKNLESSKMYISGFSLIKKVNEFYESIGGVYAEEHRKLMDGNHLKLKFIENKYKETGATYPIINTKHIYMYVGKVREFQDYSTLAHECGHAIVCYMNPNGIYEMDRFLFAEVAPIFFETLANDYISSKEGIKEEGSIIKIASYNDYLHTAHMICAKMNLLLALSTRDYRNEKKIASYLSRYRDLDKEDIDMLIHLGIAEMSEYVISYLTAMELYLKYLDNPNEALDILNKMIMIMPGDPRKYLDQVKSLGIEPGHNIDVYRKILEREKDNIHGKTL